jgi:hypothetical protein
LAKDNVFSLKWCWGILNGNLNQISPNCSSILGVGEENYFVTLTSTVKHWQGAVHKGRLSRVRKEGEGEVKKFVVCMGDENTNDVRRLGRGYGEESGVSDLSI